MSELVWEEPPVARHAPGGGRPEAPCWAELRRHPGRWALLPITITGAVRTMHRDCEIVFRTVDGERRIYARYIGEVA